MLGILLIAELCKVCRVFCWTRHTYKRSIFPAWCLQLSKTKQNAKTILVRLAFPINAHQNANKKSQSKVCLHTRCSVHFHPSQFTRPFYRIFWGSGSETRVHGGWSEGMMRSTCESVWEGRSWVCVVCVCEERGGGRRGEGGGGWGTLPVFVLPFCRKEQRRLRQEARSTLTLRRGSSWLR